MTRLEQAAKRHARDNTPTPGTEHPCQCEVCCQNDFISGAMWLLEKAKSMSETAILTAGNNTEFVWQVAAIHELEELCDGPQRS